MEQQSRRMLFQYEETATPSWASTPSSTPTTTGQKLHQTPPRSQRSINQTPTSDALFSSSLAVAILVLLSALFFLGFISLYLRRLAQRSSNARDNSSSAGPAMNQSPPLYGRRPSCTVNRKGLDPAVIASLPTCAYGGTAKYEILCPVCLSDFEKGEIVKVIPHCEHVFHVECIDRWLSSHVSCPVCRATQLLDVGEKTSCHVEVSQVTSPMTPTPSSSS